MADLHFNCKKDFIFLTFWGVKSPLTGQAKEKGKTIKDSVRSFPSALLKENVFPPSTGVDPTPKLQGPATDTRDWYSFRHTLKNVSHSSRVHFLSAAFRVPSQHRPFCSSPLAFCSDRIWISNLPVPSDTCGETQRWVLWSRQVSVCAAARERAEQTRAEGSVQQFIHALEPTDLRRLARLIHVPSEGSRGERQQPPSPVSKSCLRTAVATRLF